MNDIELKSSQSGFNQITKAKTKPDHLGITTPKNKTKQLKRTVHVRTAKDLLNSKAHGFLSARLPANKGPDQVAKGTWRGHKNKSSINIKSTIQQTISNH